MDRTRDDLAQAVMKTVGCAKTEARKMVDAAIDEIAAALAAGDQYKLLGFGVFATSRSPAREGRTRPAASPLQIPEARRAKFRALKGLKDRLEIARAA
jgi:DNA-binding protein HU-beta